MEDVINEEENNRSYKQDNISESIGCTDIHSAVYSWRRDRKTIYLTSCLGHCIRNKGNTENNSSTEGQ